MSGRLCGGTRGFGGGINALECMSNDFTPTIRTMEGFVLIIEPIKQDENTR